MRWSSDRLKSIDQFSSDSLKDHIQYALKHPIPGEGPRDVPDPLYQRLCCPEGFSNGQPLTFGKEGNGGIFDILNNQVLPDKYYAHKFGTDPKDQEKYDPWLERIKNDDAFRDPVSQQSAIFFSPHDEYFLLPLRCLSGDGNAEILGFVLADLSFHPHKHRSGSGYPDLQAVSVILNLLAGIWRHREDARTYFYALKCLEVIRHGRNSLNANIAEIEAYEHVNHPPEGLAAPLDALRSFAKSLGEAATICDGDVEIDASLRIAHLHDELSQILDAEVRRHTDAGRPVTVNANPASYNGNVRITKDDLSSIVACLISNAEVHGRENSRPIVITVEAKLYRIREAGGVMGSRVMISFENDGEPIDAAMAPFIFSDRVSTSARSSGGSGLSSARLLAKAHGGDVVLLNCRPVTFGVILDISSDVTHGGSEEI